MDIPAIFCNSCAMVHSYPALYAALANPPLAPSTTIARSVHERQAVTSAVGPTFAGKFVAYDAVVRLAIRLWKVFIGTVRFC